jgi:hypothetical protein
MNSATHGQPPAIRHDWSLAEVSSLLGQPLVDLVFDAQRAHVRLSAGRSDMSDELQALCFLAGANSIFYGEKLLTTGNPDTAHDRSLFERLGLRPEERAGA